MPCSANFSMTFQTGFLLMKTSDFSQTNDFFLKSFNAVLYRHLQREEREEIMTGNTEISKERKP